MQFCLHVSRYVYTYAGNARQFYTYADMIQQDF